MREVISEVTPKEDSRVLMALFVLASLVLIWTSIAFSLEVFGLGNTTVLGVNLTMGFAALGVMALTYYRMFVPHRLVIEHGEDLW